MAVLSTVSPPVLLVVFNRPEVTEQAIARLREVQPKTLFVAADGPRPDHPLDQGDCEKTRALIGSVDWPCEVVRLEQETNLGIDSAMMTAVNWFFDNVDRGIVLEDDCLCHPDFFRFARLVLDRHVDDSTVAAISALNLAPHRSFGLGSYFFSSLGHIWGWASWRRAWRGHQAVIQDWPVHRNEILSQETPLSRAIVRKGDEATNGGKSSWARTWHMAVLASGARVAIPSTNLVENIGLGAGATHTLSKRHALSGLPVAPLPIDLQHPEKGSPSVEYDLLMAKYHNPSSFRRLRRKLSRGIAQRLRV